MTSDDMHSLSDNTAQDWFHSLFSLMPRHHSEADLHADHPVKPPLSHSVSRQLQTHARTVQVSIILDSAGQPLSLQVSCQRLTQSA